MSETTQNPSEGRKEDVHNEAGKNKNTGMAVIAYILFFIPLLTDAKNDPFVKYHVNQGFILFLTGIAVIILSSFPPIMWVSWILHLGVLILAIIGIMNAVNGKEAPLPFIGQFSNKIHI